MATTQWCTVSANPEAGQAREADLTTFWAETLKSDARYMRIQPPESNENDVIEYILTKQFAVATDVQEEMVDLDRRVKQTKAGRKLTDVLEKRSGASATPRPPTPPNAPPPKTTPSPNNANYKLDITPEDRLFTDARPDDLIILSVISLIFIFNVLIYIQRYGHGWGGKEHCAAAFRFLQTFS
jgi:hypothetical protein